MPGDLIADGRVPERRIGVAEERERARCSPPNGALKMPDRLLEALRHVAERRLDVLGAAFAVGEPGRDEARAARRPRCARERGPDALEPPRQHEVGERDEDEPDDEPPQGASSPRRPVDLATSRRRRSGSGRRRPWIRPIAPTTIAAATPRAAATICHSGRWTRPALRRRHRRRRSDFRRRQVLRVALLQVGDAEARDEGFHDRGAEHVGGEHRRDRLLRGRRGCTGRGRSA